MRDRQRQIARVVGIGLSLLGVVVLLIGLYLAWLGWRSQDWPSVAGVVDTVQVQQSKGGSASAAQRQPSWHVQLRYRYDVDGRSRVGERYSFTRGVRASDDYPDEALARAAAAGWTVGKPLPVYYDPLRPDEAVLERGIGPASFIPAGLGVGLMLLGLLLGWWQRRATSPDPT
ncbi:MAG: DUF3592 domain-containing protein [Lysobacterales bacterium]